MAALSMVLARLALMSALVSVVHGGSLNLRLVSGRVPDEDSFGAGETDAYVKIRINGRTLTSPDKTDTLRPTWNWDTSWTSISLPVSVQYEIWDNDSFLNGADDKIGESSFSITGSGTYTPSCCSSSLVLTATFTPTNLCNTGSPCGSDSTCTFTGDNTFSCRCNDGFHSSGSGNNGRNCVGKCPRASARGLRASDCEPGYFCSGGGRSLCVLAQTYSDTFGATQCKTVTSCTNTQFQQTAPTRSTDRVCKTLTRCTSAQYESLSPTTTSDRRCSFITSCNPQTEFEEKAPSVTSDRICDTLTECGSNQYISLPKTTTSDRQCLNLNDCTIDQYESKAPTSTTDRECTRYTAACDLSSQYESTLPSHTNDRVCSSLSVCDVETQYELQAPSRTTDRVCATREEDCTTPGHFEAKPLTGDTICVSCPSGTADLDSNPDTACANCPFGSYSREVHTRSDIQVFNRAKTSTSCTPCAIGTTDADSDPSTECSPCPAGTFVPASSAGACSNFNCAPGTIDADENPKTMCATCSETGTFVPENSVGRCDNPAFLCAAGTSDVDSSSATACETCDSGHYVAAGSSGACSQFLCPAGTSDDDLSAATPCVTCPPGTFAPAGSEDLCAEYTCPPGSIDDDDNSATPCRVCPAGTFVGEPGSRGSCSDYACPAGTYDHDSDASTPCQMCDFGTVDADRDPTTACTSCPVGSFAQRGVTSCDTSPAGFTDIDSDPATPPVQCPPGSFTMAGHFGPCTLCAAPAVDDDSDASTPCVDCPGETTFQSEDGRTSCTACRSSCPDNLYLSGTCTATRDKFCLSCSSCGEQEFAATPCSALGGDTVCQACTVCNVYVANCTATSNSICQAQGSRALSSSTISIIVPVIVILILALIVGLLFVRRRKRERDNSKVGMVSVKPQNGSLVELTNVNDDGYLDVSPEESRVYSHLNGDSSFTKNPLYRSSVKRKPNPYGQLDSAMTENSAYDSGRIASNPGYYDTLEPRMPVPAGELIADPGYEQPGAPGMEQPMYAQPDEQPAPQSSGYENPASLS